MSARKLRIHAGLLFVQLTFGAFPVVGKGVLATLHPLALAGLRVAFATPLLLLVSWRVERVRPTRRHLPALALLGLLGMFANQVLYILGLARTTAGNAGILMPSIPVFALAVAAITGIERLTLRRGIGVSLAVAGAVTMLDPANLSVRSDTTVGNALILANCLSYAFYLVLQRPVLRQLPPLTVVAWAYLFGSVGVLAVSVPYLASTAWAAVPSAVWLGVAYIVLIPTSVNYVINSWAIRRSSPSLVATYSLLQPAVAAGLGVLFLAEAIGARELAGFGLIVTGLWCVSGRSGLLAQGAVERRD